MVTLALRHVTALIIAAVTISPGSAEGIQNPPFVPSGLRLLTSAGLLIVSDALTHFKEHFDAIFSTY